MYFKLSPKLLPSEQNIFKRGGLLMSGKKELKRMLRRVLFVATIVSTIIYLIWRIFFTIPFEFGIIALVSGLALIIVEIIGMFEAFVHYKNMSKIEIPVKPTIKSVEYPHVDVFIPTYTEPVELLFKTINACTHMDYPDKNKVHIYLCDDGNRTEMKELAKKMNINYLSRSDNENAKAGNLNNALKNSSSPYIVTIDADMIPKHWFLMETVPYFMAKEYIGFVQTPQDFYNPDLFQYYLYSESRIPNEQDYFYHDVQLSRNKTNSVIYGGSNTMLSRKALEDVGGFVTGVLTEDFATGMAIQSKGYICYAIGKVCASGLSPTDLKSLIRQRQRWARGCIQSGRKLHLLFLKGLNISQKINYLSSITYWYAGIKRFIYIISPILFSVFGVMVVKITWPEVLIFWLPMYLFSTLTLRMLSRNIRSTKWTNVYETILFPSLMSAVILETFYVSKKKFEVTSKIKDDKGRAYLYLQATPPIILTILSFVGIYRSVSMLITSGSLLYVIVLFWLVVNLYNLIMAIFFMLGRKMFRNVERTRAEVHCNIDDGQRAFECMTYDLSDTGLSIQIKHPLYLPNNSPCKIVLQTDRYKCTFDAQVVRVISKGKLSRKHRLWLYAFKITSIDEDNQKQYYQIIYDRDFDLPKSLNHLIGVYDDLKTNIVERSRKQLDHNRSLPRVNLEKSLPTKEGNSLILAKFNYEYAEVKNFGLTEFPPHITFIASDTLNIICNYVGVIELRKEGSKAKTSLPQKSAIYKIENRDALAYSETFQALLGSWIEEYERSRNPQSVAQVTDEVV
jgi:cellulose synthase (UDP-forming)